MQQARAETRRAMDAQKARGADPDMVSGASRVNYRSPKEANPQVRLACGEVASDDLDDADRLAARGRLLLIFDSARHPLRHVSFERSYPATEVATAIADLDHTRRRLTASFGPSDKAPPGDLVPTASLPWLSPRESAWRFADLQARVSAIHWGARGVVVSEIVEVPWPVRADAPGRPRTRIGGR